jgi:hypothetical protein
MKNEQALQVWKMMHDHCKHQSETDTFDRCMYYGGKDMRICAISWCPVITPTFAKEILK